LLHELTERSWLRQQGKHSSIDFSDEERKELWRYFEAIAEVENENGQKRIRVDRLEDMLISLGLAKSQWDVNQIMQALDDTGGGELDFDQWLTMVRTRADPAIFQVFKAMIDGTLGDSNLNFRTVISNRRRGMIMAATGASHSEAEAEKHRKAEMDGAQLRGKHILYNFSTLQNTRYVKGEKRGERGEIGEDAMSFKAGGVVPTGNMQMLWHSVCQEQGLAPSRPATADKRTLESPKSPRDIIRSIVQGTPKINKRRGGTLVIGAPSSSSLGQSQSAADIFITSRPSTQEGRRDRTVKLG
jgi:hypothetical protein